MGHRLEEGPVGQLESIKKGLKYQMFSYGFLAHIFVVLFPVDLTERCAGAGQSGRARSNCGEENKKNSLCALS